ncbi:MAG: hypothetical protein U0T74_07100 [Chitinophagales bacterium]
MRFKYYCLTTDSGVHFINVKLNGEHNIIFILLDALRNTNPKSQMLTPLDEKLGDVWELGIETSVGYFKVKVELPYEDVWITGTTETIRVIDTLLEADERFERMGR